MAQWVDAYFFRHRCCCSFPFHAQKFGFFFFYAVPFTWLKENERRKKIYKLAKGHTLVLLLLIIFHWKFFFSCPVRCASFIAFSQKLNCFSFHANKCHPFLLLLLSLLPMKNNDFCIGETKFWPKEISCQDVSTKMLNFLKPSENRSWYRYVCVSVCLCQSWY